ncbi:MAG: TetR/AcrR family transcriptional regulator [Bacteroidales bacterium]|nr:TetR/AcrR family transcriptional regulator [Bacteroidales bacterium]
MQILKTALNMFLRSSYKEVSLSDIVREVGLTKGAFYHYYRSKEQVFEEATRYFYNHVAIMDYKKFPRTSLKDFYLAYLEKMQDSPEGIDNPDTGNTNVFIFISEAIRHVPDFFEIHFAQKKKECWAWAEIIGIAKQKKEIKTTLPDDHIAMLFLNVSDGIAMNSALSRRNMEEAKLEVKRDWDNLYSMLTK